MNKKVAVIGAGAAGLIAAGRAAERGHRVVLLEKNGQVGKKILISGKGRCNITNNADVEELIRNVPGNGNFLYSSFYTFSNLDIMEFFKNNGVDVKVERGGRVFPVSDNAKDVADALERYARQNGAEIMPRSPVSGILTGNGEVKGVLLKDGRSINCDVVILATGGASYPGTGSAGDGYAIASALGHRITTLRPSLVPLVAEEKWVPLLQGLSLRNISITMINKNKKKIYTDFGEMLFTHFGVSGPVILSASRHILDYDYKNILLSIDLKPALSEEKLYERVHRDFDKFSRKQLKNSLDELLPQKLISVVIELSGIPGDKPVNQITKEERKKIVDILKHLDINIIASRPIEEAIVTSGGVSVNEINPSTMESKLVKGLFLAGEVIDVDAYTGGFNLTIAFSTGYMAGSSV